jgi:hypothetical protein
VTKVAEAVVIVHRVLGWVWKSESACEFDVEVEVGEGDGELLGGGVEGEDAVLLEGGEGEVTGFDGLVGVGEGGGVVQGGDGESGDPGDFVFEEAGDDDEVALAEEFQGREDGGEVFAAEVCAEDDEGAAGLALEDAVRGFREVAWSHGALVGIEVVEEERHGVGAAHWWEPAVVAAEGHGTDAVAFAEGDAAEEEHGIERVVELGELAIEGAEAAAAVGHEDDGLVPLFLEFAAGERVSAGGGFPVDCIERVTLLVVAELAEFAALAVAGAADDAHLGFAVLHSEEGEAEYGFVVWIDGERRGRA